MPTRLRGQTVADAFPQRDVRETGSAPHAVRVTERAAEPAGKTNLFVLVAAALPDMFRGLGYV